MATVSITATNADDQVAQDVGRDPLERGTAADGAVTARDASDADRDDDDAPITADEIAEWDRVGRVLVAHPAALRRILAALSTVQPVRPRAGGGTP